MQVSYEVAGNMSLKEESDGVRNMLQTITYAKFMILAKDQDWETAEQSLQVALWMCNLHVQQKI